MPSRKGQRPKAVLGGADAIAALEHLVSKNPELATVINKLGRRILELPEVVGLRWDRESVTYDVAFVSARGRRRAFATFTTPSYRGTWTPAPPAGTLYVGVRVHLANYVGDESNWLQERQFKNQGGGGWHDGYVHADGREMETAFTDIEQAYDSWN